MKAKPSALLKRLLSSGSTGSIPLPFMVGDEPNRLWAKPCEASATPSNQHQYSLLHRAIERDVLPFSQQHNIGVLAWSPLASGFLADGFDLESLDPQDFRRRRPFAQEPAFTRLKQLRAMLQTIAQYHHKNMVDLAIAW